jgi:hypothetical protein
MLNKYQGIELLDPRVCPLMRIAGATLGAVDHTTFKILTASGKSRCPGKGAVTPKYRTPVVLGSGQDSLHAHGTHPESQL